MHRIDLVIDDCLLALCLVSLVYHQFLDLCCVDNQWDKMFSLFCTFFSTKGQLPCSALSQILCVKIGWSFFIFLLKSLTKSLSIFYSVHWICRGSQQICAVFCLGERIHTLRPGSHRVVWCSFWCITWYYREDLCEGKIAICRSNPNSTWPDRTSAAAMQCRTF